MLDAAVKALAQMTSPRMRALLLRSAALAIVLIVALAIGTAIIEGLNGALLAILIYLCAVPFLLVAGAGFFIFFLATAYVQGRIYFELAAMRFHPAREAKLLRKQHAGTIFVAGLFIAAFVSIPVVNLATPLFATAFMVHVYKDMMRRR